MAVLRSPDSRLRLEIAVRASGRVSEVGTPALRASWNGRTLLNWSPLLTGSDASQSTPWRLDRADIRAITPNGTPGEAPVSECHARFVSAQTPAVVATLSIWCVNDGMACRFEPSGSTHFRWPRDTQGIAVDPLSPTGFATHPIAAALERSPHPVTVLFPYGVCAVLGRRRRSWLLIVGASPADLPGNRARILTALASGDEKTRFARRRPFPAPPLQAAAFNCTVPFVVAPALLMATPLHWAPPALVGVTAAHRAALRRIRALRWGTDGTYCLRGEIGDYLLTARRRGTSWQISALTAIARVWTIRLPFLETGVTYRATWRHDPQPDRPCFVLPPAEMTAASRPLLYLADAGGFTLDLVPRKRTARRKELPCCPPSQTG